MDVDIFEAERVNAEANRVTHCSNCGGKLHPAEQSDPSDDICSDCFFSPTVG